MSARRALGRWDLAAIGINQTIGGAVFLMPSQIAAAVGAWSPIAILGGALVTMVVAVSMLTVPPLLGTPRPASVKESPASGS